MRLNAWSNIFVSRCDPELKMINDLGRNLGKLPVKVRQIRELITRFEVCHFKYKRHLDIIEESISSLEPKTDTGRIGSHHVHHGENAVRNEPTGRGITGLQFIHALKNWLEDHAFAHPHLNKMSRFDLKVNKWLGEKNPDKERMVRLLIARITWDWDSYEKLKQGGLWKNFEIQVCSMDICHYAFPKNLEKLIKGIGKLKPVSEKDFEGCGSFNPGIRDYLEIKFLDLDESLKTLYITGETNKDNRIKAWLIACLMKTIKENIHLSKPITMRDIYFKVFYQ